MIDLHMHSTESDGSLSVSDLVNHLRECSIDTAALCDHDTTRGTEAFRARAHEKGINGIGGVEISAEWPSGNCHILGLGVRTDYEPLETMLKKTRDSRDNRNEMIIEKLVDLGVDITLPEVEALAGGEVVSRPHMARVMLHKNIVGSTQEAFDTYLAKGKPAYVNRFRLDPPEAVRLLKEASATAVLAHPTQLKLGLEELDPFVKKLADAGLDAIEVYTPYTPDELIGPFLDIAEKYGLAVSGGSDFHGESKPDHFVGYYRKETPIPESELTVMRGLMKTV